MRLEDPQTLVADLAASHGDQLRRFLVARVRNVADVPDIIQEVYLRMLRIPNIESIRSPEAYLFTVAQHAAQQHTLRQAATPPSVELTQMLDIPSASAEVDPALAADAAQCVEQLQDAIEELGCRQWGAASQDAGAGAADGACNGSTDYEVLRHANYASQYQAG